MFTEKERFLANEASLVASLLGNGLNTLRKADIKNKGLYYQAFFSLSIGIERLLKIIIINQYRCEHNEEFPTDIDFKKISHNLNKLCEYANISFEDNSIHKKILEFLNEFATKARYFNIDSMIDKKINYYDPLYEWYVIAKEILELSNTKITINNKQTLANMLGMVMDIKIYDLQGNEINETINLLNEVECKEIVQSYSVQYVFEIIRELVSEIRSLEREKYMMPVLSEFFSVYNYYWKPYEIRKRKNWLE